MEKIPVNISFDAPPTDPLLSQISQDPPIILTPTPVLKVPEYISDEILSITSTASPQMQSAIRQVLIHNTPLASGANAPMDRVSYSKLIFNGILVIGILGIIALIAIFAYRMYTTSVTKNKTDRDEKKNNANVVSREEIMNSSSSIINNSLTKIDSWVKKSTNNITTDFPMPQPIMVMRPSYVGTVKYVMKTPNPTSINQPLLSSPIPDPKDNN